MIGEGEPLQHTDGPGKMDLAKEAVQMAARTVKETTQSDAIERDRRPDAPLDQLAHWVRRAPLQALAVGFLLGTMLGRRRL